MKRRSAPKQEPDSLGAWEVAGQTRAIATPCTDLVAIISRDQSPEWTGTGSVPEDCLTALPPRMADNLGASSTGVPLESMTGAGTPALSAPDDDQGGVAADGRNYSRPPSLRSSSTQSDWSGPAAAEGGGGMAGNAQRINSCSSSSPSRAESGVSVPYAKLNTAAAVWHPKPSARAVALVAVPSPKKAAVPEAQKREPVVTASSVYVANVFNKMGSGEASPVPDAATRRLLKLVASTSRKNNSSSGGDGQLFDAGLLVSNGLVTVPAVVPPVQQRTRVLPPIKGSAAGDAGAHHRLLANKLVQTAHYDYGHAVHGAGEGPMEALPPSDEQLALDSNVLFGWKCSPSRDDFSNATQGHPPGADPSTTGRFLDEDVSFTPEVAYRVVDVRDDEHGTQLEQQQERRRFGSRLGNLSSTLHSRSSHGDGVLRVSPTPTATMAQQLAFAFRVPTREAFPDMRSGGSPTVPRGSQSSTVLARVLSDPKRKRRLLQETPTDTVAGLLSEGFRLHRLFATQMEADGLTLSDFCREFKVPAQHLLAYIHIVGGDSGNGGSGSGGKRSTANGPRGASKRAAAAEDARTADGGGGGDSSRALLRGLRGDDIRRTHRVVCDYIKRQLLLTAGAAGTRDTPTPQLTASATAAAAASSREFTDDQLLAVEGLHLRQQWRSATRADGLSVPAFCGLFQEERMAAALSRWLQIGTSRHADVERLVRRYLLERATVKARFVQLVEAAGSSVGGFCNAYFLSLADVDGWLSDARLYDKKVVPKAWSLVLASEQREAQQQRRLEAVAAQHRNEPPASPALFATTTTPFPTDDDPSGGSGAATKAPNVKALAPPVLAVRQRRGPLDPKPIVGVQRDKFTIESIIAHLQLREDDDVNRAAIDCTTGARRHLPWRTVVAQEDQKKRDAEMAAASPEQQRASVTASLVMHQRRALLRRVGAPMADGYWKDSNPWARGVYSGSLPPAQQQLALPPVAGFPGTQASSSPQRNRGGDASSAVASSHSHLGGADGSEEEEDDSLLLDVAAYTPVKVSEQSLQTLLHGKRITSSHREKLLDAIACFEAPGARGGTYSPSLL